MSPQARPLAVGLVAALVAGLGVLLALGRPSPAPPRVIWIDDFRSGALDPAHWERVAGHLDVLDGRLRLRAGAVRAAAPLPAGTRLVLTLDPADRPALLAFGDVLTAPIDAPARLELSVSARAVELRAGGRLIRSAPPAAARFVLTTPGTAFIDDVRLEAVE